MDNAMHPYIPHGRRGLMIIVAIMLVGAAWAYDMNPLDIVMTREHPQVYQPGETIEITVIVNASVQTPARAMGVREMLPEGWTFVAARGYGDDTPGLLPPVGAGPELEFAWIVAPYLPYAFSYLVAIPERDGGDKTIFGAVEYRLDDGPHFSAPVITFLSGPEEIAPVILLRGANPMRVIQGAVWREPGYTALDRNDMDISSLVVITGSVDTGTPGEYRLVYEVVAEDSSLSARAERVVHVVAEAADLPEASPLPPPMGPEDGTPSAGMLPNVIPAPDLPRESRPLQEQRTPNQSNVNTALEFPDLSSYRPITETEKGDAPQAGAEAAAGKEERQNESMKEGAMIARDATGVSEANARTTVEQTSSDNVSAVEKETKRALASARRTTRADSTEDEATHPLEIAAKQRKQHWLLKVGFIAVGVLFAMAGWRCAYGVRSRRGRRGIKTKK